MGVPCSLHTPSEQVINEIQYFMAVSYTHLARQMYGKNLSAEDFTELCGLLTQEKQMLAAQRLWETFRILMGALCRGELLEEAKRTPFVLRCV